jgi:hypothetical protein
VLATVTEYGNTNVKVSVVLIIAEDVNLILYQGKKVLNIEYMGLHIIIVRVSVLV